MSLSPGHNRNQANWLPVRMILPAWFDHLQESFSYREFHFKTFCPPVKTSCPPTENINATPGVDTCLACCVVPDCKQMGK